MDTSGTHRRRRIQIWFLTFDPGSQNAIDFAIPCCQNEEVGQVVDVAQHPTVRSEGESNPWAELADDDHRSMWYDVEYERDQNADS